MFFSLFSSKNQKLVEHWSSDHIEIVSLANSVVSAYESGNNKYIHQTLETLKKVTIGHLMEEDTELIDLLRDSKKLDRKLEKLIVEFRNTFKGAKTAVLVFLTKYTYDDAVYDENFIYDFKELINVLGKRIDFEENNLYAKLKDN